MNEKDIELLIQSVKEGGKMLRGEKQASPTFEVLPLDITSIRNGYLPFQAKVAAKLGAGAQGTGRSGDSFAACGGEIPQNFVDYSEVGGIGKNSILLPIATKHFHILDNKIQNDR